MRRGPTTITSRCRPLTWALTYRANHSRPFPFSLLQYSPNLAFSSWSKSSLEGTEQEKQLSALCNKDGQSGQDAGEGMGTYGPPAKHEHLTYMGTSILGWAHKEMGAFLSQR